MHSQFDEERILQHLFDRIGGTNRVAVDLGAGDGWRESNTAWCRARGWAVWMFDAEPRSMLVRPVFFTADNVGPWLTREGVPDTFDLLSIDLDGNDLWIWRAMPHRPRVVVVEFNPRWEPHESRTIPYNPRHVWDRTNYYGASVRALVTLGQERGYELQAATPSNLIFVQTGLMRATPLDPADVPRTRQKPADPLDRPTVAYPGDLT